jgi:hypothetical protein
MQSANGDLRWPGGTTTKFHNDIGALIPKPFAVTSDTCCVDVLLKLQLDILKIPQYVNVAMPPYDGAVFLGMLDNRAQRFFSNWPSQLVGVLGLDIGRADRPLSFCDVALGSRYCGLNFIDTLSPNFPLLVLSGYLQVLIFKLLQMFHGLLDFTLSEGICCCVLRATQSRPEPSKTWATLGCHTKACLWETSYLLASVDKLYCG